MDAAWTLGLVVLVWSGVVLVLLLACAVGLDVARNLWRWLP